MDLEPDHHDMTWNIELENDQKVNLQLTPLDSRTYSRKMRPSISFFIRRKISLSNKRSQLIIQAISPFWTTPQQVGNSYQRNNSNFKYEVTEHNKLLCKRKGLLCTTVKASLWLLEVPSLTTYSRQKDSDNIIGSFDVFIITNSTQAQKASCIMFLLLYGDTKL